MKSKEFYEYIETLEYGDYLVKIKYKYTFEQTYCLSNEILSIGPEECCWLNDWYEGQHDVYFLGMIKIDNIDIPENLT